MVKTFFIRNSLLHCNYFRWLCWTRLCNRCYLFVCSCAYMCVCQHDYCKSNRPILLKLGVMIGPTYGKNRLYFGFGTVPDTDSRSLFHFPHDYRTWGFMRFISISHTVTGKFSRNSAKWLTPTRKWFHYISAAIPRTLGSGSIWKYGFKYSITFGWG